MSRNLLIISLVLACLACRIMSDDSEEEQLIIGGVDTMKLGRMAEDAYRTAVERVHSATEAVKNFAETSYEERLKPIIEPSVAWVSETTTSWWDNIKSRLSNYWSDPEPQ